MLGHAKAASECIGAATATLARRPSSQMAQNFHSRYEDFSCLGMRRRCKSAWAPRWLFLQHVQVLKWHKTFIAGMRIFHVWRSGGSARLNRHTLEENWSIIGHGSGGTFAQETSQICRQRSRHWGNLGTNNEFAISAVLPDPMKSHVIAA